ncbi:MAG: hypothetical protein M4579_006587 [Chaenotheca gracillima]|nr:MAG: hypothetical protein M4579_006587 [Chaenotheca gracillima]
MAAVSSQPSQPTQPPSLSFPPATFAKLSPLPFLLAHLRPSSASTAPVRPNGRQLAEFRPPTLNTNSLSFANGSAVVRTGDTAVVCGVRGEILMASDVPGYRVGSSTGTKLGGIAAQDTSEVQSLGLLVPNLELATGCSPAHLPGQPPSALAQSLSIRLLYLLHTSKLVRAEDLRIWHQPPSLDDDEAGEPSPPEVKAFWTLYIDILFISLDGNPFDAAWAAVLAALRDTKLPHAYWDIDREMILCDEAASRARKLQLQSTPITSTFACFAAKGQGHALDKSEKTSWVLADPDDFEQDLCKEYVTLAVDCSSGTRPRILKIEKSGGGVVGKEQMKELVDLAAGRWKAWQGLLQSTFAS